MIYKNKINILPSIRSSIIYNESALINRKTKSNSEIIEQNMEIILKDTVEDYNKKIIKYSYNQEEDRVELYLKKTGDKFNR